ncbi:hypothetical protein H072_9717 [Dactylellina haptotyla CBS 200.50]|uniref:PPPDE domain-containing protein n=1 Tax=Dactylellina haptotyla (strain CBS 200.50) TaxID=1284197 RepID=S8A1Y1_DACHA|nr:hypothetical protein H072_9717 [Dactylellina haptotyla CBS 200.50]
MSPQQNDRRNSESATTLINRGASEDDGIAITINVYDLLPPGKLSTVFWTLGVGLLHTGVAINDREYAFGGHDRRGVTGVYWMKPKQEPPGATFRMGFVHAHVSHTPEEIHQILIDVSQEFQGTSYNVLTRNCNHFTSYLCEKLTGTTAPKWINRAASIGVALPCVVPQAWVRPPECEEEDQLNPEDFDDEGEDSEWDDRFDDRFGLDDSDAEADHKPGTSGVTNITVKDKNNKENHRHNKEKAGRSRKSTDEGGMLLPQSERAKLDKTVD